MKTFNRILTIVIYLFFGIGGEIAIWTHRGNSIPVGAMVLYGLMFLVIFVIITEVWSANEIKDEDMKL